MYCKIVKFFYPLVVTSFEDSVHELLCFHMYRPVQSREREEGQVCIVASVYGMIDCYCTLRFRYELINLDAMCCISKCTSVLQITVFHPEGARVERFTEQHFYMVLYYNSYISA